MQVRYQAVTVISEEWNVFGQQVMREGFCPRSLPLEDSYISSLFVYKNVVVVEYCL